MASRGPATVMEATGEMGSLRTQLMHGCQQTASAITSNAEQGVAKLRAEFGERESKLRDLRDAENENYSLQQIIDDLREHSHHQR